MKVLQLVGIALFVSAMPLLAAVPFENDLVPGTVFREFNGGTAYRGLPDDFPVPASLPPGLNLRLVGTLIAGSTSQVVLRSASTVQQLRTDLLTAYQATGWLDVSYSFAVPAQLSLCHDKDGLLDMRFSADTDGSKITASRSKLPAGFTLPPCAQQKRTRDIQRNGETAANGFLPAFTLPAGATVTNAPGLGIRGFISGGNSSSADSIEFTRDGEQAFELTATSMTAIFQHYASQLQQQGWTADSDSVGSRSSASVWFKTKTIAALEGNGTQEAALNGTLEILQVKPGTYRYKFMLRAVVPLAAQ